MPSPARTEPVEIRTEDGWLLRGERLPDADAPAVVVCGHAMMVDRRTLDRPRGEGLASALHAGGLPGAGLPGTGLPGTGLPGTGLPGTGLPGTGLDVAWVDARGHGESGPRAEQGGRWSYDDIVRFDVPALVRLGRELAAGRPVVLLGHSLIGHAGLIAAGLDAGPDASPDAAPDALVAYAPNLWAPHLEARPGARAAKAALLTSWLAVSRARGFFDARGLGIGTDAEALPYIEQFQRMWRRDRLESPDGALSYEAALARATLPVLAYASDNDRLLARPSSVDAFLALAPNAAVDRRVLRGPDAPDHMGFVTAASSRPIWEETAAWIRDVAAG